MPTGMLGGAGGEAATTMSTEVPETIQEEIRGRRRESPNEIRAMPTTVPRGVGGEATTTMSAKVPEIMRGDRRKKRRVTGGNSSNANENVKRSWGISDNNNVNGGARNNTRGDRRKKRRNPKILVCVSNDVKNDAESNMKAEEWSTNNAKRGARWNMRNDKRGRAITETRKGKETTHFTSIQEPSNPSSNPNMAP